MTRERIAIFIPSLRVGGVQRWALNLSREFANLGFETHLVLVNSAGVLLKQVDQRVRIFDLGAGRALFALPRLVGYLNEQGIDVLLTAQTHINVIGIFAAALARVRPRVIVSEHNHLSSASTNGRIGDRARAWLARFAYPRASAIVAVSRGVAQDLSKRSGISLEKIRVIYNPVVDSETSNGHTSAALLPWEDREQYRLILAVGRLEAQKDFLTLLRAFDLVSQKKKVRLLILGEGSQRRQLEGEVTRLGLGDVVALPGFVERPLEYMRSADLFALSSRWEGLSTVLIEALACGVPVVSTDCPSSPAEILLAGKLGRLVPVGDSEQLAEAIIWTLQNLVDKDMLQARARDFSVEQSVIQYTSLIQENKPASFS